MCEAQMKRNEDGSYTVTVNGKSEDFPDCVAAANWADSQRFDESEEGGG